MSESANNPAPQPAARPKRRWYQFSLRTLLIGTAVVAACLGISLHWIAPAHRQQKAVQLIERQFAEGGGFVE